MSDYFVKLDRFEGPLDLLLHLIKVHEIDIFDIDIEVLTREYLKYLRLKKFQDIASASAFIAMAATLIEIKTRMLLPNEERGDTEADDDEVDPVAELQERLIQHEIFQKVAAHLDLMPQMGVEIQTNSEWERLSPFYDQIERPLTGDVAALVVLFENLLKELAVRKDAKVTAKTHRLTLDQVIAKLGDEIDRARFSLFQGYYNLFKSRDEFVVHGLAMLELCKMKKIKVHQEDMFGPIWMYRFDLSEADLPSRAAQLQKEAAVDYALDAVGANTKLLDGA